MPIKDKPNQDEVKQKAKADKENKTEPVEEKLKESDRCRPSDTLCIEYWKKKGVANPTGIGQLTPQHRQTNPLANLLAANISAPDNDVPSLLRGVSDVPFGLSSGSNNSAASIYPMMMQGPGATYGTMPAERVKLRNQMGGASEDLFSGNYHWSLPLVSLPGRAGHDVGLSLHYNSHLWIKAAGNYMQMVDFYEINANPGYGFNVGLPRLRTYTHIGNMGEARTLLLPSGRAIELVRRTSPNTSAVYDSIDGSLLHLVVEGMYQYLFYPDGTRLKFQSFNCIEMRDANGNLITVSYYNNDPVNGLVTKITDTLGREIIINYNAYFTIQNIQQTRTDHLGNSVVYTLADFGYSNVIINTNFASGITSEVPANTVLPMLTSVRIADDKFYKSLYKFDYNSYGQVKTIHHYAPTSTTNNPVTLQNFQELSTISYNLPSTNTPGNNAPQSNCPRFTQRSDSALEWDTNVITSFSFGANNAWGQVTAPDNTKSRLYFLLQTTAADWWKEGLVYKTEAYNETQVPGAVTPKRTTLATWEFNTTWGARVMNSTVTDGENSTNRYTDIYYQGSYNLPVDVFEYNGASSAGTLLRSTNTAYLTGPSYIRGGAASVQRWIVGLPTASYLYDGNNVIVAKTTYQYDESTYNGDALLVHQAPASQTPTTTVPIFNQDAAYATETFTARGNLTSTCRWDVNDINNAAKAIKQYTAYNTTGSPITQYLPDNNTTGRKTIISYADSFSNATVNNTLAYPTTITDAEGHASTLQYRYDLGAIAKTTDPKGAFFTRNYDNGSGQLKSVVNGINQATTTYVTQPAQRALITFTSVDATYNAYSATYFDGHGRVQASISEHPNSVGGYRTVYNAWDQMGRLNFTTSPTETDWDWNPVGDDLAGFPQTFQDYDWKGRPTTTTNPDFTIRTISYNGCGCTGSETVTTTDEVGRQQRVTRNTVIDGTGWVDKTEILNTNGTTYSTTATRYNARGEALSLKQSQGQVTNYTACPTGTCREETMEYDGLGRMFKKHRPIESLLDAQGNVTTKYYTNYEYYPDGAIKKVTDPRGAIAKFYYNARGLTTGIKYNEQALPAGIAATSDVSFQYDSNGNRTKMTDGQGELIYTYDTLSRLLTETRTFTGLPGTYALSYDYTLSGRLKQLNYVSSNRATDNFTTFYEFDTAGRYSKVTGDHHGDNAPYAHGVKYRAWDAVKEVKHGVNNAVLISMNYNARLQLQEYKATLLPSTLTIWKQYEYYGDGNIKTAQDKLHPLFNRSYEFDQSDRLQKATTPYPYNHTYTRNTWGETTAQTGNYWSQPVNITASWKEGRRSGWQYDQAGHVTDDGNTNTYDASGRNFEVYYQRQFNGLTQKTDRQWMDGNGQMVKKYSAYKYTSHIDPNYIYGAGISHYYLRSSVLNGEIIAEVYGGYVGFGVNSNTPGPYLNGERITGYVYAGGALLAKLPNDRIPRPNLPFDKIIWQIKEPITGLLYTLYGLTDVNTNTFSVGLFGKIAEPDEQGLDVWDSDPFLVTQTDPPNIPTIDDTDGYDPTTPSFYLNGFKVSTERAVEVLRSGTAIVDAQQSTLTALAQAGITGHITPHQPLAMPGGLDIDPDDIDDESILTLTSIDYMGSPDADKKLTPLTPAVYDKLYRGALLEDLDKLNEECQKLIFGNKDTKNALKKAKEKIINAKLSIQRYDSNKPIQNSPTNDTVAAYWKREKKSDPNATVVTYNTDKDVKDAQKYNQIILGNNYDHPSEGDLTFGGTKIDSDLFRRIIRIHEYLHWKFQESHRGVHREAGLASLGFKYSSPNNETLYSHKIDYFLLNCLTQARP